MKFFLKISDSTYTQFETIRQKLHDGISQSQAKPLGDVLSDLSCEIIEQVFFCAFTVRKCNHVSKTTS